MIERLTGIVNEGLCLATVMLLACGLPETSRAAVECRLSVVEPDSVQKAVDKAFAAGGGMVVVPKGEWVTKPISLKSNVTLKLEDGAVLSGSTNLLDYARADTPGISRALLSAEEAENVAIVGKGRIDGRGHCFKSKFVNAAAQPTETPMLMKFVRCRNVRLEDFFYGRSPSWSIHLVSSDGVEIRRLTCFNHCNLFNDGIDIESRNVLIEDCVIDSEDDALCFKSETDKGFLIENVTVRRCRLASTCNFIKFGTGSYGTWRNILIEDCVFDRAKAVKYCRWDKQRIPGVQEKITGRAGLALEVVDGGRMENVTIRNITMNAGIGTPLFVRLGRRHANADGRGSYFKDILIENVKMTQPAASRIASSLTGVPGMPLSGITLRNCDFFFPGGGTSNEAADTNIPEVEGDYPEFDMFNRKALPAYGLYLRHVDGLTLENVKVRLASPDSRPAAVRADVRNCKGDCVVEASEIVTRLRIPDLVEQLGRPILPEAAWMSSDRVSRAPFGDRTNLTRRVVACETLSTGPYGELGVERVAYRHANGLDLPAVLFLPSQRAGAPVVIIGESGRRVREQFVTWALGAWRPVMALDLFGTGEIAGCPEAGKENPAGALFTTRLKARGESLLDVRVAELTAVLADLKARFGAAATVLAGSSMFEVAQAVRARRSDLVFEVVRACGSHTQMPSEKEPNWRAETAAFQARIDALAAKGGGTLVVEPGLYRLGAVSIKPGVNLHLKKNAVLLGVDVEAAYPKCTTRVEGRTDTYYPAILNADHCDGFTITGEGIVDGLGYSLWHAFWSSIGTYRRRRDVNVHVGLLRPRVLFVSNSKNVDVSGVTFKNSKFWTTHFYRCTNLKVHDCAIYADVINGRKGPSTDAIDLDGCRDVLVENVLMNVNDDAVVMKGGMGVWANDPVKCPWNSPTENVLVRNCTFGPMCHACLTLGSDCFLGRNATLRDSRMLGASLLLHLKMRVDTPQLYENVLVENCTGRVGTYLNAPAWTQMTDLKGLAAPPPSVARHVTMRNNRVAYKTFQRLAKEPFVTYEDFDIRGVEETVPTTPSVPNADT